jgi:opacity protein-like surface antigen
VAGFLFVAASATNLNAQSQGADLPLERKNTFGFFTAYSNDSSHILMGVAANRKLFEIGASYDRKLVAGNVVNWQYSIEVQPVALESDPVLNTTYAYTTETDPPITYTITDSQPTLGPCHAASGSGTLPGIATYVYTGACTRRWTIGEAMSPIGFQWNFLPRRKLQPYAVGHGGYMYSTQPIPTAYAGSFNFTFDFGAGVELFRTRRQSVRAEYRFHHISNHDTANENPGIDNGLFQVAWTFGK